MALIVDRAWDGAPADRPALVLASRGADHVSLWVVAPLVGDPPPPGPPGTTPRLWEHEVVEWFCAGADDTYLEVEVGPWGHHLVLQLDGVRQVRAQGLPLDLEVHRTEGWWSARATLPIGWLPPAPWRAAAFRLHGGGTQRAFLTSTPLPGATPDFHQPVHFPELAAPLPTLDAVAAAGRLAALLDARLGPADPGREAALAAAHALGGPPSRKGGAGPATDAL